MQHFIPLLSAIVERLWLYRQWQKLKGLMLQLFVRQIEPRLRHKRPILRDRYLFTRSGKLRLRYSVAVSLVVFTAFAFLSVMLSNQGFKMRVAPAVASINESVEDVIIEQASVEGGALAERTSDNAMILPDNLIVKKADPAVTPIVASMPEPIVEQEVLSEWQKAVFVKSGDTLSKLLNDNGYGSEQTSDVVKALAPYVSPQSLKPGQKFVFSYKLDAQKNPFVDQVVFVMDGLKSVEISQSDAGVYEASLAEKDLIEETRAVQVTISNSLFYDLNKAGVPDGVISNLIKTYSWSVDFQRDIWGGETVELLYNVKRTADNSYMRSGDVQFANLVIKGKENPIYRFEKADGIVDYFGPNGQSIRKALLSTPIDGARMSSGFGMRKHPVLGYSKMHKGTDFAAATGTPIYAAGDGVIEKASVFSSYGNYIRIRHNDTFKTAYAHLNGYAKGIKAGVRVKQGQVIGYVGTTGRSTGPHLHYEVLKKGVQVNPRSVDLPIGEKLGSKDMVAFKAHMSAMDQKYASVLPVDGRKLAEFQQ